MRALRLRVVQVWHGSPLEERSLPFADGAMITVGPSGSDTFTTPPSSLPPSFPLLRAHGGSFSLSTVPGMTGTIHVGGQPLTVGRDVPPEVQLGQQDWGIVSLDDTSETAFFFEVHPPPPPLVRPFTVDNFLASGLAIAALIHGAILCAAFLVAFSPVEDDLGTQPDRVAKLILDKEWPPRVAEEKLEAEKKAKVAAPKTKQQDSSKRAAGKEGRFGDRSAHGEARIARGPRDAIVQKVQSAGVLGAIKATKGDSSLGRLLSADNSDVTMALNGMSGVSRTQLGNGANGLATRGESANGGGGKGGGQIIGIGNLQTGGGNGKTSHPSAGGGRVARETAVAVAQGDAGTDGSLSKEQIYKVVASHVAAIQFCFEKELQRFPHLQGKVVLGWRVELDGTVSSPRVVSSALTHPPTEGCMVRTLKGWTFPKPQGTVAQVSFPFLFRGN